MRALFSSDVQDAAFHPSDPFLVAAAEISGAVSWSTLYSPPLKFFNPDSLSTASASIPFASTSTLNLLLRSLSVSTKVPAESLEIYSAGADASFQVLDSLSGKPILKKASAHADPINCIKALDRNVIATGDDEGVVKIWDTRDRKLITKYTAHDDYISSFSWTPTTTPPTLLATSADGRLSVYDLRKKKPVRVSDFQDDELLSHAVVRDGSKVVVGSEDGVLSIYSWGDWGDCTDRIRGHPGSVNAIVKLDERRIATACVDGNVRVVGLFPNKILTRLRDHECDMPVERLALNADGSLLASCSHENIVRFWDANAAVSDLNNGSDDDNNDSSDDNNSDSDESLDSNVSSHSADSNSDSMSNLNSKLIGITSVTNNSSEIDSDSNLIEDNDGNTETDNENTADNDNSKSSPLTNPISKTQPVESKKNIKKRKIFANLVADDDSDTESPVNKNQEQLQGQKQKQPEKKPKLKKVVANAKQNAYFGDLD
ncbi:WD domain repeat-containing protein 55 [Physocladia obscura]|uniref:WD repeat-containing protein JIP5 n=1 Tax=Physocladia obscura TaxID=109957 RepID=A0AAD5T458_9FUNG|nr:WD domain repeat-containing protein 55 [Physocladia obscura]